MHDNAKEEGGRRETNGRPFCSLLQLTPTPGPGGAPHKNTIMEVVRPLCVWSANKQLSGPGKRITLI